MIDAKELRIGNWIDGYHSPYDRTQIDADCFSTIDSDGFINGNPIPLTPEILTKCGFDNSAGGFVLFLRNKGENYELVYIDGEIQVNYGFDVPCKYLHQFQNLYYALTGNELKVNLKN